MLDLDVGLSQVQVKLGYSQSRMAKHDPKRLDVPSIYEVLNRKSVSAQMGVEAVQIERAFKAYKKPEGLDQREAKITPLYPQAVDDMPKPAKVSPRASGGPQGRDLPVLC
jgi:hypothetical protein